ncbi:MAG: cobalamin-dependent protein [Gammaproteobacteria bacterium]|nr:cobalamin-dependent protein [Gammaproteobacteria bacterium]
MATVDATSSAGNPFAAELLERSAAGFGGFAASVMLEKSPEIKTRYKPDPFADWKSHLTQRILELAAAVNTGEPLVFTSRVLWSRKAFLARNQEETDLVISLAALRDVLADKLPAAAAAEPLAYVEQAMATLSDAQPTPDASELDPQKKTDRLALRYLQDVLEGNSTKALDDVLAAGDQGMSMMDIYTQVLMPAQREIGRLWHLGDVSISEEHLVTSATQRAMAVVVHQASRAEPNGKTMVAAAVTGNVHDIGLRAISDVYQIAGWRTVYLGADVPMQELPSTLTFFDADLLLMSATLSTQLPRVRVAIKTVRDRCERDCKILVGGAAFDEAPEVWRKVGADGYAGSMDDALAQGARLVGL